MMTSKADGHYSVVARVKCNYLEPYDSIREQSYRHTRWPSMGWDIDASLEGQSHCLNLGRQLSSAHNFVHMHV